MLCRHDSLPSSQHNKCPLRLPVSVMPTVLEESTSKNEGTVKVLQEVKVGHKTQSDHKKISSSCPGSISSDKPDVAMKTGQKTDAKMEKIQQMTQKDVTRMDTKVFKTLTTMRRILLLERFLNEMGADASVDLINNPELDQGIQNLEKRMKNFSNLLKHVKECNTQDFDWVSVDNKNLKYYTTTTSIIDAVDKGECSGFEIIMYYIHVHLNGKRPCQTCQFFHEQWHLLEDIIQQMSLLQQCYDEQVDQRFHSFMVYRFRPEAEQQPYIRALLLGLGIFIDRMQLIVDKCSMLKKGCATCRQENVGGFHVESVGVVTGKAAQILQMAACIKRTLMKEDPCKCCMNNK